MQRFKHLVATKAHQHEMKLLASYLQIGERANVLDRLARAEPANEEQLQPGYWRRNGLGQQRLTLEGIASSADHAADGTKREQESESRF